MTQYQEENDMMPLETMWYIEGLISQKKYKEIIDLFEDDPGLKIIGDGIDKLFLIDTKVNWFFRIIRWVNTIEDVVAVFLAGLVNAIGDFKAIKTGFAAVIYISDIPGFRSIRLCMVGCISCFNRGNNVASKRFNWVNSIIN